MPPQSTIDHINFHLASLSSMSWVLGQAPWAQLHMPQVSKKQRVRELRLYLSFYVLDGKGARREEDEAEEVGGGFVFVEHEQDDLNPK